VVSFHFSVSKTSRKLLVKLKKLIPKKPRSKKKRILLRNSLIFISLGLIVTIFGGVNYYRVRTLSFNSVPPEVKTATKNIDIPVEIMIPSIKIDLPVDPGEIDNGVWKVSAANATFLSTSAAPGNRGNTVIYGHNLKAIFGNLPYLSVGQKIIIKTKSGKIYNYVASQKYFVGPDRTDLVSPTIKEELTIYTCWGVFDSQRAVIKASPI
jgi:LPXTG-site transpeptidase (sortase) family protein